MDILLSEISTYLKDMRKSSKDRILLFNEELQIIASPEAGDLFSNGNQPVLDNSADPLVTQIASILKEKGLGDNMTLSLKSGGDKWHIKVMASTSQFNSKEYILYAISESNILGPLAYASLMNLIYAMLLFLLSIPLIIYIASRISLPIKKLSLEAKKIAENDFSNDINISSSIKEINDLSYEMTVMKRGLRSFNKYVPSRLVSYLLEKNEDIEIGGDGREVTVMFTDIADFTTISESCSPQTLMQELSAYFDRSTHIIRRNNGLVDKYIGDAVMAIWNTPQDDPAHPVNACRAALEIRNQLNSFAEEQEAERKLPFRTRIGLDTGVAVVGNVGSSDRMNYTVIGDIVNNASRLEGVNKLYNTEVLISQNLADKLDDKFVLRPVAKVVVKGKAKEQRIYELVEERVNAGNEVIMHFENFEKGFNLFYDKKWNEAIKAFQKAMEINSSRESLDFIEQCRQMIENPPDESWSGIRVLREK